MFSNNNNVIVMFHFYSCTILFIVFYLCF